MFDSQFSKFLHGFVTMYNTVIFNDTKKCKSLLLDHAKGEFAKEIRLLFQVLELGCHTEILRTNDISLTRMSLIKKLQNEYFITEDISTFYIDLLLSILRNCRTNNVEKEKEAELVLKKPVNNLTSKNISRDYEKEAKAERLYKAALKKLFLAKTLFIIDSLLKAIKLCPNDRRFHFLIAYCFYKVNDTDPIDNEIKILQKLGYDNNLINSVKNEINSSKQGHSALWLIRALNQGGLEQMASAKESILRLYKFSYPISQSIYEQYLDFIKWSEDFDKLFH
jgi:hypothetical protein